MSMCDQQSHHNHIHHHHFQISPGFELMSTERKYTVVPDHQSSRLSALLSSQTSTTDTSTSDSPSQTPSLLDLSNFSSSLDAPNSSSTSIDYSQTPITLQAHAHAQSLSTVLVGGPHAAISSINQYHIQHNHQATNAVAPMDSMQTTTTLSAPSPPDSSSPISMSSSPIPPTLVSVGNSTIPTNTRSPANVVCQPDFAIHNADYLSSSVPQNIHYHHLPSGPYMRMIEHATNRIRYRYKSEKGSHGGLTGESSTPSKKTYPTVKLENVRDPTNYVIKASLFTNEAEPKQHAHKLMGRYCNEEGYCVVQVNENGIAVFQNLGILFVGKKEVPEIMFQRKLDESRWNRAHGALPLETDHQRLREEAEREAKDMNLNSVRIRFDAYDCSQNTGSYPVCEPIYSKPISNQKSIDSGELKIVRLDRYSGSCVGDDEVFPLCEKVNKKEIKVRFFETNSEGNVIWEAYGTFNESDVHHQVCIVFRTPPYRDTEIEDYVQVYLQLYRPKDNEYSEPRPFTYCPRGQDKMAVLEQPKRKKPSPEHDQQHIRYGCNSQDVNIIATSIY